MLFHELYGSYYNVAAQVLSEALEGEVPDSRRIRRIIEEKAFDESILDLPGKLKNDWHLLLPDGSPVLFKKPTMPLTLLQKRWLKALLSDPRIRLFSPDPSGLEDVSPLFTPETFVYYDRNLDGDPYADETYISAFRTILQAFEKKCMLKISFLSAHERLMQLLCLPKRLEYSEKDDKFRLLASGCSVYSIEGSSQQTSEKKDLPDFLPWIINLSRICSCELYEKEILPVDHSGFLSDTEASKNRRVSVGQKRSVLLEVTDIYNTLERILLAFSPLEKEVARVPDQNSSAPARYHLHLTYDTLDETEILIRILSLGFGVKVLEPEAFAQRIRERLQQQKQLLHE